MLKLLKKECRLTASVLSFLFIAFSLLTFFPGYQILIGAFFVCMGIFQSFQQGRENNDILYTALLPVKKRDVVLAKFVFTVTIELVAFLLMAMITLIRMIFLCDAGPYVGNALMNANFVFLGFALIVFGLFQACFLCGFFRTAYRFAGAFIRFIVFAFIAVLVGESLHYLPGCAGLNATGFTDMDVQLAVFAFGLVFFVATTLLSYRFCVKRFEQLDL